MINPSGIPQFTGDFEQLDKDVSGLRKDAIGIRNNGSDIHSRFQMLEAFYVAPEADDLFATTRPVMDRAETFATKLETVADALDTYSGEAAPLAKRLDELKADAYAFAESVEGDDDWTEDEDKFHRNEELVKGVTTTQLAFQEAERRAASKISALVGGPRYVTDHANGFVRRDTVPYGYDKALLENAEDLPWGSVDEQSYEAWSADWFGHGLKSVLWDGVYKDGMEAGVVGLWTMAGGRGGDAAGDVWGGLFDAATGVGLYATTPYDALMDSVFGPDKESAEEARAKKAAREFGKGVLAWDQWEENPARAAGTVAFNVLTLGSGPLVKAGAAGEAGALAKGAGALGRAGLYLDPITATAMATGKVAGRIPALSELTSRIMSGSAAAADAQRVHSVIELDDGSRVVIDNGEFIAYDRHGRVVNEVAPPERSAAEGPQPASAAVRERDLTAVGSGSRGAEPGHHAGDPPRSAGRGTGTSAYEASPTHAGSTDNSDVSPGPGDQAARGQGATDRLDEGAPEPGRTVQRPGFMREGGNPYGPPGTLTPEQIKEIQVYRANHEPGYFERYYGNDGRRIRTKIADESGFAPTQLSVDPVTRVKSAASDAPPPIPEKYLGGGESRTRHEALSKDTLKVLDEAAARRRILIDYSESAHRHRQLLEESTDSIQRREVGNEYSAAMDERTKAAEAYGETIAEHQVIPELYPQSVMEELHGPKNGNFQFDQVWRRPDGGFVVVEAKSNVRTGLGKRDLLVSGLDGRRSAMQGSREYFMDTLQRMRLRGRTHPSEMKLANDLKGALGQGKLDYILVKGKVDGDKYAGYEMVKFNIG